MYASVCVCVCVSRCVCVCKCVSMCVSVFVYNYVCLQNLGDAVVSDEVAEVPARHSKVSDDV